MSSNLQFLFSRSLRNCVRRLSNHPSKHSIAATRQNDSKLKFFEDLSSHSSKSNDQRPVGRIQLESLSPCQEILTRLRHSNQSKQIVSSPEYFRYLWYLPFYSRLAKRQEDFVDVMDDWWLQLRPVIESEAVKISSLLIHLGKLQEDLPHVSIVQKVGGWKSIDLILKRMVEIGFNRYRCKDINSAFAGLLLLTTGRVSSDSSNRFRPIHELKHFRPWIIELKKYIMNKSTSDPDWETFLEVDASVTLSLFRQLEVIPPTSLLTSLCIFSKMGFDVRKSFKDFESRSSVLTNYSDAMVWFNINPNSMVPGSWDSWYSAWKHLLDAWNSGQVIRTSLMVNPPTLHSLAQLVVVAADFDLADIFSSVFDSWRVALVNLLMDAAWLSFPDSDIRLTNTIYNLGKLVWNSNNTRLKQREGASVIKIMTTLQDALVKTDLTSTPSTNVNRVLSGFMYLRRTFDRFERNGNLVGFPSNQVLDLLEKRYHQQRQNRSASPDEACTAAECLLLLSKLDARPSAALLKCLLAQVCAHLSHSDEKVLCYSGEASVNFLSPKRLVNGAPDDIAAYERFWTDWFAAVAKFLQAPAYSSPAQARIGMPYLLSVVIAAADWGQRHDEFRRIQPLWEKQVTETFDSGKFNHRRKTKIVKSVIYLRNKCDWKFDPGFLKRIIELLR